MDFEIDLDTIDSLAQLISSNVSELKSILTTTTTTNGRSNIVFDGAQNTDDTDSSSRARTACMCITSASAQLMTLVRPPEQVVFDVAMSFHIPSALRLVVESHVPEILRTKDEGQGVYVSDIARVNGVNTHKLGHVMRLLATHYIFDEVAPNQFANNRLSATIDTGGLLDEIMERPLEKYGGREGGFAALVAVTTDESMRNAQFMTDALTDRALADSFAPEDAPFALAMWPGSESESAASPSAAPGTAAYGRAEKGAAKRLDMFAWMAGASAPQNRWRLTRFGCAMAGVSRLTPADAILRGFRWTELGAESVVVDVGGGIGAASLPIVESAARVRLVIEDRPAVLEGAVKYWQEHLPEALESGRVTFVGHDFFHPQPALAFEKGDTVTVVYLLRMIMHNWADEHAKIILAHLRAAADARAGETKLVIVDGILEPACRSSESSSGVRVAECPPVPLLGNWGAANGMAYKFDIQMLCNHNAGERTFDEFCEILGGTGWGVVEVYWSQESWMPQIVACPV